MNKIDELAINTLRIISVEAVQKANSGHPGLPLGSAPMAYTLWAKHLKHNPENSKWIDRDRFVLSAGHGSMLLYSLLNLFGYDLTMKDIMDFRQLGSRTPGHPEFGYTDGVETTTGPLGQGVANAVGMAIAETYLAEKFNRNEFDIINHYTYALAGDGCMMEGISSEACSLAGTLKLGKLILLYDSNSITIEGSTNLAFKEDVGKRFEAYEWQVLIVEDGNNTIEISDAIARAKEETEKPSLIIVKTVIGYGSPNKQGKASAHGEPLGVDELEATKAFYKWNYKPFELPEEINTLTVQFKKEGVEKETHWNEKVEAYQKIYPDLYEEFKYWLSEIDYTQRLIGDSDFWKFEKPMATREASGILINRLLMMIPNLVGGSADLAPSNKTNMKNKGDYSSENRSVANFHFGVREHAMSAISNGIQLHGGLRTFASTFFVFTDYMKAGMRLSSIMKLPITYVLTHDSIGVGEDGPTHEPVEHLAALRSMPGMTVFRPADAKETAVGWYLAVTKNDGPVSLVLTRQNLPLYDETGMEALRGAYILKNFSSENDLPDIILIASGSEVELIMKVAVLLNQEGINARVVSIPSFELFEKQEDAYKEYVLPSNVTARLAVEAGTTFGWHRYTGLKGKVIGIDHYGASGKAESLFEAFGFTVENVMKNAKEMLKAKSE
jgi:transketolase